MKKIYIILLVLSFYSLSFNSLNAQTGTPTKVNFDDYEKLVAEVKEHRKERLLNIDEFLAEAKKEGVILLDARSDAMYNAKHLKGAIHLNFSDFTQENLAKIIPSFDTKVLIYCNNNFNEDEIFFPTKMVKPEISNLLNFQKIEPGSSDETVSETVTVKPITLALNIPTYINLYGYGYRNVYELGETIRISDNRLIFEGTAVKGSK